MLKTQLSFIPFEKHDEVPQTTQNETEQSIENLRL